MVWQKIAKKILSLGVKKLGNEGLKNFSDAIGAINQGIERGKMKKIIIFIASFMFVPFIFSEILKEYFSIERSIIWCLCSISFLVLYIILPLLDRYIKMQTKYMRCVWFLVLYLTFVVSLLNFLS